jgi:hypothetical protein
MACAFQINKYNHNAQLILTPLFRKLRKVHEIQRNIFSLQEIKDDIRRTT